MEKPNHLIESEEAIPSKFIYDRQLEPIPFTMHLFRTFKEQGKDAESLAWLYLFYYSCARQQGTDSIFAVNDWTCKMLHWNKEKLKRIKAKLKELGCIVPTLQKDSEGKIVAHYIHVKFVYHPIIREDKPEDGKTDLWIKKPEDGKTSGWKNSPLFLKKQTNSSKNDNEEEEKDFPATGKTHPAKKIKSIETKTNGHISPDMFERFWKMYPKKGSKGKALTIWLRICTRQNKETPEWIQIKRALFEQKETEQWTKEEGKYIPLASTWLNQSRWLDDPKELVSRSFTSTIEKYQCPEGWKFGIDYNSSKHGCMKCEDNHENVYLKCKAAFNNK